MSQRIVPSWLFGNNQKHWLLIATIAAGPFSNIVNAVETPLNAVEPPKVTVQDVLAQEAQGNVTSRLEMLNGIKADDLSINWQSGNVFVEGSWVNVNDLNEERVSPLLQNYLKQRGDDALGIEDHRRLAKWCDDQGLKQQSRAHYFGVLNLSPNDEIARMKLDFQLIDGRWVTKEEIRKAELDGKERIQNAKVWMPAMRRIAIGIQSNDTTKKNQAITELRKIDDPAAIYSLHMSAIQIDNEFSLPFVHAIQRFKSKEACLALLNIAIVDTTSVRGQCAIEGLKNYDEGFFVPELLPLLSGPTEIRHSLHMRLNGELVLQEIQFREFQDKEAFAKLERVLQMNNFPAAATRRLPRIRTTHTGGSTTIVPNLNPVSNGIARDEASRDVTERKAEVDAKNLEQKISQDRIFDVLEATTGAKNVRTASAWWSWWDSVNEELHVGQKRYDYSYNEDRRSIVSSRDLVNVSVTYPTPRKSYQSSPKASPSKSSEPTHRPRQDLFASPAPRIVYDCLVAGAFIQTNTGLKEIETIREGDLVLSQNIESGEIGLKPVLKVAIRSPGKTIRLTTEGTHVEATAGHFWWVSGKGWVRTKDLEVGMQLHDVTGTSKILAIEDTTDEVPTYNLVVADFHTYFVGPERLLSNDGTELRATLQVVPGLPSEVLAKK